MVKQTNRQPRVLLWQVPFFYCSQTVLDREQHAFQRIPTAPLHPSCENVPGVAASGGLGQTKALARNVGFKGISRP